VTTTTVRTVDPRVAARIRELHENLVAPPPPGLPALWCLYDTDTGRFVGVVQDDRTVTASRICVCIQDDWLPSVEAIAAVTIAPDGETSGVVRPAPYTEPKEAMPEFDPTDTGVPLSDIVVTTLFHEHNRRAQANVPRIRVEGGDRTVELPPLPLAYSARGQFAGCPVLPEVAEQLPRLIVLMDDRLVSEDELRAIRVQRNGFIRQEGRP
jgi:hypothetical protein